MIPRKILAQELADISDFWENSKVDTRKYYQSALDVWEVSKEQYLMQKDNGGLCQIHKGRYYIA